MDEDTILRLARKIRDAWNDAMLEWLIDLITEYDIS